MDRVARGKPAATGPRYPAVFSGKGTERKKKVDLNARQNEKERRTEWKKMVEKALRYGLRGKRFNIVFILYLYFFSEY